MEALNPASLGPEFQGQQSGSHAENGPNVHFGKASQRTENEPLAGRARQQVI